MSKPVIKKPGILSDEEIHEYTKDEECRGYPIKSGWVTDEIMPHLRDIAQAQNDYDWKEMQGEIEEAKKQERERIMGILEASDTPLDIKTEQALKEKK